MTGIRLKFLPWLVLAASLGLTWLAWAHERQTTREQLRSQFDFSLRETVSRIEQRIATYEQILRGVQGMFTAIGMPERDALTAYVASLQLDANFSGVQSIGIAELVPVDRKDAHVAAMRRRGFADYAILPEGRRDLYAPITQREPSTGLNLTPPGADPWSDPVRRQAMERARDSGMAAMSGKVQLFVDTGKDHQPGFIIYLPIYALGQPHDSIAQRRANLVGWIYASFRIKDLMGSLYGETPRGIAFTIHDGVEPVDAHVLYRFPDDGGLGRSAAIANTEYLVVAGHTWALSARTREEFETRFGRDDATSIAAGGAAISTLLALLARLMATGRVRAQQLAESMTKDLRHAVARTETALEAERQAIREQRNFLAMVSHEFRAPLSIIAAAAQLLAIYNRVDGEAQDEVSKIGRAVRRLSDLIDVYLADDRLDSTMMALRISEVDLGAVLVELCDDKRPRLSAAAP